MPKDPTRPRLRTAERGQLHFLSTSFDELIPPEHRVRSIWKWLNEFDLGPFYARVLARGSGPGRPATDPRILLCLWVFATSEGIGSARHLERLCERDLAYRWILGGVTVNHHLLSDFRTQYEAELDQLMTEILGVLLHAEVLTLQRVSQDGMRVRAHAGASSFRKEESLQQCLEEARHQVEEVKRQPEEANGKLTKAQQSAQERAAREQEERIRKALEELPKARTTKTKGKDGATTRTSTTDSEARVMKMGDGGFRPAYNLQLAVDTGCRVVVGVEVTNRGSDSGEMEPMLDQIETRTGKRAKEILVDGGFTNHQDMQTCTTRGTTVYAPVPIPRRRKGETDEERAVRLSQRFAPRPEDPEAIAAWRFRMGTDEAKEIYKQRAATIETVNGDLRKHRGLQQFPVVGRAKVRALGLLYAITYNLLQFPRLLGP